MSLFLYYIRRRIRSIWIEIVRIHTARNRTKKVIIVGFGLF